MIDTEFNPWLIEINTSPSMEYSTVLIFNQIKNFIKNNILFN